MSLQRQHFLLSYFNTLSGGPAGSELTTSCMTARCSTNRTTGVQYWYRWCQRPGWMQICHRQRWEVLKSSLRKQQNKNYQAPFFFIFFDDYLRFCFTLSFIDVHISKPLKGWDNKSRSMNHSSYTDFLPFFSLRVF